MQLDPSQANQPDRFLRMSLRGNAFFSTFPVWSLFSQMDGSRIFSAIFPQALFSEWAFSS
jgi:hypothetical protein